MREGRDGRLRRVRVLLSGTPIPDGDAGRATRWIELDGAFNVRDLGGLAAAHGVIRNDVLLRADKLDGLSAADVALLTGAHRLRVVVDLRSAVECPEPPGWIAAAGVGYRPVPLFDLSGETAAAVGEQLARDVASAYRRMLELSGPAIAQVLDVVVGGHDDAGAVAVHCAAGKDRTGIVVAVLLRALGVAEDVVVADYLLSAERIEAVRSALRRRSMYRPRTGAPFDPVMTAAPIEAVLAGLREEPGGVAGYLARWGVTSGQLARFRTSLLRP